MFIQTESKAQGWRAMAAFDDGVEALIFVGRSSTHVREGYGEAYLEQFEDDERERVTAINLQQWQGTPDAGRWLNKAVLRMPAPAKLKLAA